VLFRKRDRQNRLRPLSERECYLRLHGARSGEIEVVAARPRPPRERPAWLDAEPEPLSLLADPVDLGREPPPPAAAAPGLETRSLPPTGPTDLTPALHLVFAYPRGAGTVTGEQLRRGLLRRMQNRQGEAA
jgi:hypothetical protein